MEMDTSSIETELSDPALEMVSKLFSIQDEEMNRAFWESAYVAFQTPGGPSFIEVVFISMLGRDGAADVRRAFTTEVLLTGAIQRFGGLDKLGQMLSRLMEVTGMSLDDLAPFIGSVSRPEPVSKGSGIYETKVCIDPKVPVESVLTSVSAAFPEHNWKLDSTVACPDTSNVHHFFKGAKR